MHPILFRIPLPDMPLKLWWALAAAAVIALVYAAASWKQGARAAATTGLLAAAGAAVGGWLWRETAWELESLPIYSYGVMLGLSLVVGWYLTLGLAERDFGAEYKETLANCYIVTAISAIAVARLLYVVTNLDEFDSLTDVFAMRRGGLVAYGGFLGGFLGSLLFLRANGLRLMPWADVAVPSLASGLLITRIGCYMFGCDFGKPLSESAPAWLKSLGTFPRWDEGTLAHGTGSPAWVQHVQERGLSLDSTASLPVHPTQLYESAVGLGLLVLLLLMRRRQTFRGQIFLVFTFAYGIARFALEMLRDDAERGAYGPTLGAHVLLPLSFLAFAIAYSASFARTVADSTLRTVTRLVSFIPAVVVFLALRPSSFASETLIQLSTSQWVALTTGIAAAIAYAILHKAAELHPMSSMEIGLALEPKPKSEVQSG